MKINCPNCKKYFFTRENFKAHNLFAHGNFEDLTENKEWIKNSTIYMSRNYKNHQKALNENGMYDDMAAWWKYDGFHKEVRFCMSMCRLREGDCK
jgi:hypothetical protein